MFFYILMVLFRVVLDVSYVLLVNPAFEYSGFVLEFSILTYFSSWATYLVVLPFIKKRVLSITDYFLITFALFLIVPLTSLYGLTGWSINPVAVTVLSFFLFAFISKSSWIKIPYIPRFRYGDKLFLMISGGAIIFLVIWYIVSGATFNLNIYRVYEYREENSELASGGVLAYTNVWTYKIFSIFFISYFLWRRNWFFVVLGVIAQVVFYAYSAHKSVLFGLVLVFGIWFWFRKSNKSYILPLGLTVLVISCLLLYLAFGYAIFGSLIVRRVFYVPAYLTYQYFEFFSNNPFVYWSNSVLSGLVSYPYDLSLPKLIGEYVGSGTSANNGYISTGYAHFGYWGVLIYTIMFAYVLRILDVVTKNTGALWLVLAITVIPLRSALISSDFFTTLLTHGLIVIILLTLLIRSPIDHES
ncbi:hypothetical protein [Marinomonas aquiplantarum]|uniref:Oligosaccharide repeat unit polymerase n=1 Tax=Marinomonas aquiplantarum TaxID=491951 RepID=A0A366D8X8_9GAMM|nr:hypothetical protein [Marinomonas aquiplantarum]RBO85738.1 hypothetical protein DFP76_10112 [Marinomonas aquiplantarum]